MKYIGYDTTRFTNDGTTVTVVSPLAWKTKPPAQRWLRQWIGFGRGARPDVRAQREREWSVQRLADNTFAVVVIDPTATTD